jgi:hypothetical protein
MFCQCGASERNDARKGQMHKTDDRSDMGIVLDDDGLPLANAERLMSKAQDCADDYRLDRDLSDEQPHQSLNGDQVFAPSQEYVRGHNHSFEHDDEKDRGSSHIPSPAQRSDRLSNQDYQRHEKSVNAIRESTRANRSRADTSKSSIHRSDNAQGLSSNNYATGFPRCQECGKSIADGLGTALKPSVEPCVLARKPLSESTVAANVLRWGTGALNVDGCRVDGEPWKSHHATGLGSVKFFSEGKTKVIEKSPHDLGRWPANLIHDGSDEVREAFPETGPGQIGGVNDPNGSFGYHGGAEGLNTPGVRDAAGSAARFFYTSKADSDDRLGSKHPTIKPVDLIQYLCRLITPPNGTILDPFAGTGTTGEAAFREGFRAVLIEREPEYLADIDRRIALMMAGPDERNRESIKARGLAQTHHDLPLFSNAWEQMWSRPFGLTASEQSESNADA